MRTYKRLTFFILIVYTWNIHVFAQTCEDLKKELLAHEHQYQKASLKRLADNPDAIYYCNPDDPRTCESVYEAQLKYNKALAKVNMLEGMIALSMSIENNHRAIRNLTPEQISQAETNINDFLQNFEKAKVLSESLNFVPQDPGKPELTINIWEGFQKENATTDYTRMWIFNKCTENVTAFKTFCEMLDEKAKNPEFDMNDLYNDLTGFAKNDASVGEYSLNDRVNNYKEYQKYLLVVNGSQKIPLNELDNNGEIIKINELKNKIKLYKESENPKLASEILKLSNELQTVNMNFNHDVVIKTEVSKELDQSLGKTITKLSSVTGLLSGKDEIVSNFEKNKKNLYLELQGKQNYLLKHESTKSICPDAKFFKDITSCLSKICGKLDQKYCNPDKDSLNGLGLSELYNDYHSFVELQNLNQANDKMLECMNDEENQISLEQQKCLDKVKNQYAGLIENNIKLAQNDLAEAKKYLDYINKGQPVNRLLAKKLLTIKAINVKNCIPDKDKSSVENMTSICNTPEIIPHTKKAIEWANDVEKIMVAYDYQQYKDFLGGAGVFSNNETDQNTYSQMVQDCLENQDASSVCKLIISEKKKKEEEEKLKQEELLLRAKKSRYALYDDVKEEYYGSEEDGPSAMAYAAGGLATGLIKNMPGIFAYMQGRRQHDYQMQMYDNYLTRQQYLYGAGATHHTYNIRVNYDDWYANQNTFNMTGLQYFNPTNSLFHPNFAPSSYTINNGAIYLPN